MANDINISEYENLYKEISENSNKIYFIINICIVSTTAIIGYVITLDKTKTFISCDVFPFFFLLPLFIIIPSFIFIISSLSSTARISTYVKVFYEDDKDSRVSWQKNIQQLRSLKQYRFFGNALKSLFYILPMICIVLFFVSGFDVSGQSLKNSIKVVSVTLLILLWLSSSKLSERWDANYFNELEAKWQDIKDKEEKAKEKEGNEQ